MRWAQRPRWCPFKIATRYWRALTSRTDWVRYATTTVHTYANILYIEFINNLLHTQSHSYLHVYTQPTTTFSTLRFLHNILTYIHTYVKPQVCSTRHENVGLLAYSPLAGGILTGKYAREDCPPTARLNIFQGLPHTYIHSIFRLIYIETLKVTELHCTLECMCIHARRLTYILPVITVHTHIQYNRLHGPLQAIFGSNCCGRVLQDRQRYRNDSCWAGPRMVTLHTYIHTYIHTKKQTVWTIILLYIFSSHSITAYLSANTTICMYVCVLCELAGGGVD